MGFVKLRCSVAYVTGGIRSNLSARELAMKLTRHKLPSAVMDDGFRVDCDGSTWFFEHYTKEPSGLGYVGWLRFTTALDNDVEQLSARLAIHGVRHRFEVSSPRDDDTDDVRRVVAFEFRWDGFNGSNLSATVPQVEQYEEQLA